MFDIALIERGMVGQTALAQPSGGDRTRQPGRVDSTGDAHLESPSASDMDRWRQSMNAGCTVRWGRVNAVRASIAQGTYLCDQRLDEALSRLVQDMDH